MGWNYRVFRHSNPDGSGFYQIHEAHYGEGGKVSGWTEGGATVCADTSAELLSVIAMMADALGHPVLDGDTGKAVEAARELSDELARMIDLGKLGPWELDLNAAGKLIARKTPSSQGDRADGEGVREAEGEARSPGIPPNPHEPNNA